ncbi:hypothetical protein ACRRVB_04235 [Candidatus Cardinium hertigii]|uniref:hypothetical protein n=1 Tax=Candidatus Cardinium hertigii TaxID=247481 RepID=UPI003D7ECD5A
MFVGFKQDKLALLEKESELIGKNLKLLPNKTRLAIIKIPDLRNDEPCYEPIPDNDLRTHLLSAFSKNKRKYFTREKINGHRVQIKNPSVGYMAEMNYKIIKESITRRYVRNFAYDIVYNTTDDWENASHYKICDKAYPSDSTIRFDRYDAKDSNEKGPQDEIFTNEKKYNNITWHRIPQSRINPLDPPDYPKGIICARNTRDNRYAYNRLLKFDTGNAAVYYYCNESNEREGEIQTKEIKSIFDPREGNLNISFSRAGIEELDYFFLRSFGVSAEKNHIMVIEVRHKPYSSLQFNNISSYFALADDSGKITGQYYIYDNVCGNATIYDKIAESIYFFISTKTINNTKNYISLNGLSGSISYDNPCRYSKGSKNNTIKYSISRKKLSIHLTNNYVIGNELTLSEKIVSINGVRGKSNESTILFAHGKNSRFNVAIIGNIQINEIYDYEYNNRSNHVAIHLDISGEYNLSNRSMYSKNHNNLYDLEIKDLLSVYGTIKRLNNNNTYSQSIYLKDGNVTYIWNSNLAHSTFRIGIKKHSAHFKMSRDIDIIKHLNRSMYREIKEYVHHDGNAHNPSYPLKNVFVRRSLLSDDSNGLLKSIDIDQIRFLRFPQMVGSDINVTVLLFEDHDNNHHYHVFPTERINIDNIDYRITSEGICAIPSSKNRSQNTIRVLYPKSNSMLQENVNLCTDSTLFSTLAPKEYTENDSQHKHRHHHGESDPSLRAHHRGPRSIDDYTWKNSDTIQPVTSGANSNMYSSPINYIANIFRTSFSAFQFTNPIGKITDWFSKDTNNINQEELSLSDNHRSTYRASITTESLHESFRSASDKNQYNDSYRNINSRS